jgi:lipoyl(octanoyl) transferase
VKGFDPRESAKSAAKKLISIIQLGTIDYATGLRLQQQLVDLRKEEKIGEVLLLLEHSPVITLGRNGKAANVVASPELLAQRGVELFECDRGGDVTFHGPGQIVGYPIFDLRGFARSSSLSSRALESRACPEQAKRAEGDLGFDREGHDLSRATNGEQNEPALAAEVIARRHLGAVDFVRRLEEVLIRTCADFAIPTKRVAGLTGVWTDPSPLSSRAEENDSQNRSLQSRDLLLAGRVTNAVPESKLAAIGIHISRSVTSHGFALNVNTDLSYFNLIVPCGITSKPVTSMQQELGRELDLNAVAESISRNFGVVFQSQILWVDTLDALLGRTVGVPMKPPAELRQLHKEDDSTRV